MENSPFIRQAQAQSGGQSSSNQWDPLHDITIPASAAVDTTQLHPVPAAMDDDDVSSPFAAAAGPTAAPQSNLTPTYTSGSVSDADAAAIAAEAADDLAALPDASARAASATAAAAAALRAKAAPSSASGADTLTQRTTSGRRKPRKMIPLKRVIRDSYEYHGLNDLFFFCITALAVTLVLYWHWGETTATFKATVQSSFQQYGNPDWQGQSLKSVDTMYDAVEYTVGWMEFWLGRAENADWPDNGVRVGEFSDIKFMRMLVNLERNCELGSDMLCYQQDELTAPLSSGQFAGQKYAHLLDWAGWTNVGALKRRDSANTGKPHTEQWWAYTILAPKFNGRPSTRDDYIGRMYNITRDTNLNYNDCDWAAHNCSDVWSDTAEGPAGPSCARSSPQPPFHEWWAGSKMCSSAATRDIIPANGRYVQRGQRYFVRHPRVNQTSQPDGIAAVLDLKPFLTKYAYSIKIEVLATNAASQPAKNSSAPSDMALFTMAMQRSGYVQDKPDRILWQITTTLPVRTTFYSQVSDITRIVFEVALHLCLAVVLSLQVWQILVCYMQHGSIKAWVSHLWNAYEFCTNITLLAWVIFYWVLVGMLTRLRWTLLDWDVEGPGGKVAVDSVNAITQWSGQYSTWLYMGIVVDFVICLRLTRYMRIHVGLKAFYQVFIIAAREFLDFAVFLFYILVLLGSAVFAFFQLTGGNYQFLRFPDGLALMTRLTFGFLDYEEFQSQALGVGSAIYAVTGLFWVAVLLLVVYTQNIILAIVAEAYEEAKAKLGTAETSFLMLVLMRILFTTLFIIYRIRMLCHDIVYACTGWGSFHPGGRLRSLNRMTSSGTSCASSSVHGLGPGSGPDDAPGPGPGAARAVSGPDLGAFGNANSPAVHWGPDQYADDGLPADDNGFALVPTLSRAVLPLDVEKGLAGSYTSRAIGSDSTTSYTSRVGLLGSFGRGSSQSKQDTTALTAAAYGANGGSSTAGRAGALVHSNNVIGASCRPLGGLDEPTGFKTRLHHVWHEIILGERHMLRMYNDVYLAPSRADSWVTSWKTRYWRPWCVARTAPLRCLMNLYQDFTSYKLKEECTWTGNNAAKDVIARLWHCETVQDDQQLASHPSSSGSSNGCNGGVPAAGPSAESSDDAAVLVTLPLLAEEVWVTEDELARLFLVTSKMSPVLKIWHPPFHKLSEKEVSYLVRGIAEVYGQDEEEFRRAQQQLTTTSSGGAQGGGLTPTSSLALVSSLKDARLGTGSAPARKGGFFSSLNQKRRDGGAEQSRQVSLLLHTNKRLEELTNRNVSQLNSTSSSLKKHMDGSRSFQRKQQETNTQLLKSLQDLHKLLQSAQQPQESQGAGLTTPHAGSSAAGVYSPRAALPAGQTAPAKRFNSVAAAVTATGRMLTPFGGKSRAASGQGVQAAVDADQASTTAAGPPRSFSRSTSQRSEPDSVATSDADADQQVSGVGPVGNCADQQAATAAAAPAQAAVVAPAVPAADSAQLVLSLQQQLEQQQKALQLQQELLHQVLARLPPAQQ